MRSHIRRLDTFKGCVSNAYRLAKRLHWTDEQLRTELTREVYQHKDYPRLTRAEREYVRGFTDSERENLWRNDVIWRLGPESGPLAESVDGWKMPSCCKVAYDLGGIKCPICDHDLSSPASQYLSTLCRIPGALFGGHFWKGTEKAFTAYHCTNAPVEGCSAIPVAGIIPQHTEE